MPLRVLHVVPYYFPAWAYGGIPRVAYGLCRELARRGVEVTVCTTDAFDAEGRGARGRRLDDGVHVHRFPNVSNHLAYHHQLFLPLGALSFLKDEVARSQVVHVHGHRHVLEVATATACRKAGIPLVLTANGTAPALERKLSVKKAWDLLWGNACLQTAAAVTAVSAAEVSQYLRAGIPLDRIHRVPNGIDLGEFEALPRKGTFRETRSLPPGPLLLFLGKLTPRKGVDHLIEAHSRLKTPGVHLVIAGNDMGEEARLKEKARRSPAADRVMFTGLLTGEERLAALADADVLAYPSAHEIFGLVPFEGLLSGAPVVVGDDCGCGELVVSAGAGLQVPFGDADALASRLDRLLSQPEVGRAMVARGRTFIREHLSWEVVGERTLSVYHQVMGSGPPGWEDDS